jgi:hypothetical protein
MNVDEMSIGEPLDYITALLQERGYSTMTIADLFVDARSRVVNDATDEDKVDMLKVALKDMSYEEYTAKYELNTCP